jgi:xylulokinase
MPMMQAQRTIYLPNTEGSILTFDVGTSALKAALFTRELELVSLASVAYQARAEGERVEMEPGDYLGAMRECVVSLGMPRKLSAIGITTQGETLIPVGTAGEPLRRAIVWLDARAEREAEEISRALDADVFYQTTGLPEINGALPLSKALWLRQNEPEVFSQTHQLLLLEDYIRLFLTGESATHASLATSTGWLDVNSGDYWQAALDAAGISRALLPQIVPSGTGAGSLTTQAARYLGLRAGTPVFTGAMDQTAAVLALATRENVAVETLGTAHVVAAATEHPVFDSTKRVTIYRHALDGKFVCLPIGNTGGMALTWFLREFGLRGEDYASFDRACGNGEPGCNGVHFLPYLCGCVIRSRFATRARASSAQP